MPNTPKSRKSRTKAVVLFGGTDTTIAVAEAAYDCDVSIAGVITVGESYRISYSVEPVSSVRYSNVTQWCESHGVRAIPFSTYEDALSSIETAPDLGLVAGWYHLVPRRIRERSSLGCIGFHASLLPQLRGGAPLNWAILDGLRESGVTMFELSDGVDDGPIYAQRKFRIFPNARVGDLIELANEASRVLVRKYLEKIIARRLQPRPQRGVPTYSLQRLPEDGLIDWRRPAIELDRLVRAVARPYPGAYTHLESERIYIWRTELPGRSPRVLGVPGQIARIPSVAHPCVVTGNSILGIVEASVADGSSAIERLGQSAQKRFEIIF